MTNTEIYLWEHIKKRLFLIGGDIDLQPYRAINQFLKGPACSGYGYDFYFCHVE